MPHPESACGKERGEKSGSHAEAQQRQIFRVEDCNDQYGYDVVYDGSAVRKTFSPRAHGYRAVPSRLRRRQCP